MRLLARPRMRIRLQTRLWWTALLVWLLLLLEAFYPPGRGAIAGGGDGPPRRPPLPSWVRARRFLSLFGSSSSQATGRSEVATRREGGSGQGLVAAAGGTSRCRASGAGLAAGSAMAAQQAGGDMGDAVDGGCTPGRARGGARGDFSTDGVAKAAQLFLDDLSARMQRMDKPPQASFRHSYGGEFEAVSETDRVSVADFEKRYQSALAEENLPRNRYSNVLANEHSRVRLSDVAIAASVATQGTSADRSRGFGGHGGLGVGVASSDYINANRIAGVAPHAGYIATQAPLAETASHFWHMVVDEHIPVIVMLNRLPDWRPAAAADRYWPGDEANSKVHYDSTLSVMSVANAVEDDRMRGVVVRRFRIVRRRPAASMKAGLANGSASRTAIGAAPRMSAKDNNDVIMDTHDVIHFQFCTWPDQGVPDSAELVLDLLERVDWELRRACGAGPLTPVLVHCSAGVGRTGTLIAIDLGLRQFLAAAEPGDDSDDGGGMGSPPSDATNGATSMAQRPPPVPPLDVDSPAEIVKGLKQQRSRMVQTPAQYRFVFEALGAGIRRLAVRPPNGADP